MSFFKKMVMYGAVGAGIGSLMAGAYFLREKSGTSVFPQWPNLNPEAYELLVRLSYYRSKDKMVFARIGRLANDICSLIRTPRATAPVRACPGHLLRGYGQTQGA